MTNVVQFPKSHVPEELYPEWDGWAEGMPEVEPEPITIRVVLPDPPSANDALASVVFTLAVCAVAFMVGYVVML